MSKTQRTIPSISAQTPSPLTQSHLDWNVPRTPLVTPPSEYAFMAQYSLICGDQLHSRQ